MILKTIPKAAPEFSSSIIGVTEGGPRAQQLRRGIRGIVQEDKGSGDRVKSYQARLQGGPNLEETSLHWAFQEKGLGETIDLG